MISAVMPLNAMSSPGEAVVSPRCQQIVSRLRLFPILFHPGSRFSACCAQPRLRYQMAAIGNSA